jgi:hypothetical protein
MPTMRISPYPRVTRKNFRKPITRYVLRGDGNRLGMAVKTRKGWTFKPKRDVTFSVSGLCMVCGWLRRQDAA